jgi:diaminopimelate decarboxylase
MELDHVLPIGASEAGGVLHIGGLSATELASRFGTPVFVFDVATFRDRARRAKEAFPDATIYYAAKAFLTLGMCRLVEGEGLGLDVASGGELHVALAAGFPPERMIFHGNNKADGDILRAVEEGIGLIAIDNLEEIDRVAAAAVDAGKSQPVVIRVTPGIEAHTHEYIRTGQEDTKFGLSIAGGLARQAAIQSSSTKGVELVGIHSHIGSNILSFDAFGEAVEVLWGFLSELAADGITLRLANLGGGVGIPYTEHDSATDLEGMAKIVHEAVREQTAIKGLDPIQLSFEPGRFLIGNAMVTLYEVGAIKEVPGVRTFVSVDGGMSDNIRPSLYQATYTAFVANKMEETERTNVTIAGVHCESGDILIRDVPLASSIRRGDLIVVPATGAYGYSMASNYNKQPRPPVIAVEAGEATVMVRRESFDDLMRLDETDA